MASQQCSGAPPSHPNHVLAFLFLALTTTHLLFLALTACLLFFALATTFLFPGYAAAF